MATAAEKIKQQGKMGLKKAVSDAIPLFPVKPSRACYDNLIPY
jgi:hypothetical protein